MGKCMMYMTSSHRHHVAERYLWNMQVQLSDFEMLYHYEMMKIKLTVNGPDPEPLELVGLWTTGGAGKR